MAALTIGQVARQSGVGVETLRFYERTGLIEEPPRRDSGYRQYPVDTVRRVRFIRRAKALGFTLKEISDLLSLRVDTDSTCADVRDRARSKILDIEERIRRLEGMRDALKQLAATCAKEGRTSECPILEALYRKEQDDDEG
ncbi:MAG: MerR family DNA-binding protein [Deltaproteobacteria bacterium]|nr:MerR family DNA-binding protein [Deltaproteobacteria bacterium]